MRTRVIEVERCAIDECPYCKTVIIPEDRWCTHPDLPMMKRIRHKVETFPRICPLIMVNVWAERKVTR